MARTPVNGLSVAIAATFGTSFNITAITNASEAVATLSAAHGVIVGDYVQISTSGWPKLEGRVFRAKSVATNDVTLESCNTSNTSDFPAGAGTGTGREILTWTPVGQILGDSMQSSGGEMQYNTYQYLDQDQQVEEPTFLSPGRLTFTIDDDIAAAGQLLLETLMASRAVTPFRLVARTNARWLASGVFSMSVTPTFASNTNVRRQVSIALRPPVMTPYAT